MLRKPMNKLLIALLFGFLLFGCVSQKEYNSLAEELNEEQQDYQILSLEHEITEEDLTKIKSEYDKLNETYNKLQESDQQLKEEHDRLQMSYEESVSRYDALSTIYYELLDSYRTLQQEKAGRDNIRLPSEIPTTQRIAGLEFILSADAFTLSQQNLNLSSVTDTKSMLPTISSEHTVIFAEKFDTTSLKVGDIIAYNSKFADIPILHRIIERSREDGGLCYIVQGDNNPVPDPECVKPSNVIGLAIGVIFNTVENGYRYCLDDLIPVVRDDTIYCMPNTLPKGVYTQEQQLPSDGFSRFSFCADEDPSTPYTVIDEEMNVLCYENIS